jgi:DNA-binding transcriptional ArsR family regulator
MDRLTTSLSMSKRRSTPSRNAPQKSAALRNAAPIFAALGDATRLHIIAVLCAGGAMSIAEITSGTTITRQGIAKHLRVLAEAGLVRDVKIGRERLWECERAQLDRARRSLQLIEQQWDDALMRLKAAVER